MVVSSNHASATQQVLWAVCVPKANLLGSLTFGLTCGVVVLHAKYPVSSYPVFKRSNSNGFYHGKCKRALQVKNQVRKAGIGSGSGRWKQNISGLAKMKRPVILWLFWGIQRKRESNACFIKLLPCVCMCVCVNWLDKNVSILQCTALKTWDSQDCSGRDQYQLSQCIKMTHTGKKMQSWNEFCHWWCDTTLKSVSTLFIWKLPIFIFERTMLWWLSKCHEWNGLDAKWSFSPAPSWPPFPLFISIVLTDFLHWLRSMALPPHLHLFAPQPVSSFFCQKRAPSQK